MAEKIIFVSGFRCFSKGEVKQLIQRLNKNIKPGHYIKYFL